MKKILLLMVAFLFATTSLMAQIVTTSPTVLQEDSKNVVLTYHADQGNKGLMGVTSSTEVYAHIGVITNLSTSSSDWKYDPPKWGDNAAKYKMNYVSANTWSLNIGDIRSYFGITNASETVKKIALVFRTGDNTKEGKTESGGDIFVDVYPAGFQVSLTSSASSDGVLTSTTNTVTFTVSTTSEAKIELFMNDINSSPLKTIASGTSLTYTHTFATAGTYEMIARATKGSEVKTEKLTLCYPKNSVQSNYPGGVPKMGTVKNADGSVTFCIAAPGKNSVILVPSWDDYKVLDENTLKYQDYNGNRYFWITIKGLDNSTAYPYYYVVDAKYKVGDPYAKLVLDPWNDKWINEHETIYPDIIPYPVESVEGNIMLAVYKGDIDEYNWRVNNFTAPESKDLIIYEMLFRDFTGTEGAAKGDGTVRKAIAKIPYLKALGVNAVELMPIMEFNGNNSWGYNTNFYFAPDKAYGTHNDYREFIDKCHEAGIAVILDIVFNQSDGLHPWYQMYPIAENPFYNETAPHAYSVLNDWKQDNPLVQQQWKDVLQYWLKEFKVDGFRFDLVKGLGDNNSYGGDTEKYNQSRVDRMKTLHSYIKEINPNAYHINENLAGSSEENAMGADGQMNWANVNYASCQFAMGYSTGADNNRFLSTKDSRTWGTTVSYAESHDEERMGYKIAQNGAAFVKNNSPEIPMRRLGCVAAQMLLTPGAHMIWQFGELGADQTTKNGNNNNTDPKLVIWDNLNNEYRKGLHQSYTDLCWLRRLNPDLFTQSTAASMTLTCNASNWAAGRQIRLSNGDKELICIINPNTNKINRAFSSITFNSKDNNNYMIASKTYGTNPTFDAASGKVTVEGCSYVVIVSKNVAGIEDDIIADNHKVNVYGGQGEIIVDGEYNTINIYSITGQAYYSLNVPAGLYIVNVDGVTTKVIVK